MSIVTTSAMPTPSLPPSPVCLLVAADVEVDELLEVEVEVVLLDPLLMTTPPLMSFGEDDAVTFLAAT